MNLVLLAVVGLISGAEPRVKLGQGAITFVEVPPAKGALLVSELNQRLTSSDVKVVTPQDVAAVVGLERQRQLLGCDDSECSAELAGALGVDGLITGTIGRLGDSFTVNIKVLRSSNGETVSNASARVATEAELLDAIDRVAAQVSSDLVRTFGLGRPKGWLIPTIGGAVSTAAGALFLGLAWSTAGQLQRHDAAISSPALLQSSLESVNRNQVLGWTLGGVGLAAVAGGLLWWALGSPGPSAPALSAMVSGDGLSVSLVAVLP